MALQRPVLKKGRHQVDTSNCMKIKFKLSRTQILFVCINHVNSTVERYYIYNVLKTENAIDGPHHFPEPIPLCQPTRSMCVPLRHHIAFDHEARTIYILNREGHLLRFYMDNGTLQLYRPPILLSHIFLYAPSSTR